jgi:hypothetical protein
VTQPAGHDTSGCRVLGIERAGGNLVAVEGVELSLSVAGEYFVVHDSCSAER